MKHKFQLTGALALLLMTGCLALFAQVPAVVSSAMKTRASSVNTRVRANEVLAVPVACVTLDDVIELLFGE